MTDHSTEVFLPATSTSCLVSGSLVTGRYSHTLDNLLACGGREDDGYGATTCEEFSPAAGTWARTNHTLQEERQGHVSWTMEEGTVLMGGVDSMTTSEIVKDDGTTERSFDMKYDTRCETFQFNS